MHLRLGSETARDIVSRDDALPNENVDDAGRAVEIGVRLFDLFARDQPTSRRRSRT